MERQNIFDQFDSVGTSSGNIFDQFDVESPTTGNIFDQFDAESVQTRTDFSGQEYGPSDLLRDPEKLAVVDRFMRSRYGVDEVDQYTDEEKVDKFLNTMRYFDSGNTVSTVREVNYILSSDEDNRQIYGEAMDLFQNLGGITSDAYTWGETFEAAKDYVVGAVVDPVNLLAPVYGKIFAQGGTRGLSKFAQRMVSKELVRQQKLGASTRVAQAAANRVRGEAVRHYRGRFGRQLATRELAGATAVDTTVAVGTNFAYQNGLIQTGNQEGIEGMQLGLSALGGLIGAGVTAGAQAVRGVSKLPTTITAREMSVRDAADLSGVLESITEGMRKAPRDRMKQFFEGFSDKVARGEELPLKDSEFFIKLVTGDEELGFAGLAPMLQEKGFMWRGPRGEGDNFSNWLGDAIRHAPQAEIVEFTKAFEEVSGITVTDLMRNTGKTVKDLRRGAAEVLADNMAAKMSNAGKVFNAMSRASKLLGGKSYIKVTADDYAKALFDQDLARLPAEELSKFARISQKVGQGFSFFQNTYIRMLVTHPGTSILNITGWATKSAMQSASDLVRATVIYGGGAALKGLKFVEGSAANDWAKLTGVYKANTRRFLNLLDTGTTKESFDALVGVDPKAFKDLLGVQAGGVVKSLKDSTGVEGSDLLYQKVDKGVEFLQKLALVEAQDVFTKSQEFMYNLDVLLRESNMVIDGKRMTAIDLLNRDDLHVLMRTEEYQRVQAKAIDRTLENIMGKSYAAPLNKQGNDLQKAAAVIEDMRNWPIVGIQVPFGRFFNNVVATMSEYTGLTAALRPFAKEANPNKDVSELVSKAAVFYTGVYFMADKEREYIERGIPFNESIEESTGQRLDESYDSPYIAFKAAARVLAYHQMGETPPEDILNEANKLIFGQLTRGLSGAEKDVAAVISSLLRNETTEAWNGISEMLSGSVTTAASGMTRFLEPLNAIVALSEDPEDYVVRDFNVTGNAFYKGLRYVDSFVNLFNELEAMPKVTATERQTSRETGRLFGSRDLSPMTASARVFAMIGRPDWDAGIQTDVPEAKNFFTQVFQPVLEVHAQRLLRSEPFLNASVEGKTLLVSRALEEARASTHAIMANSPKMEDVKMNMLFKLTANRKVEDIEGFMQELGIQEENIMDLDLEQLQLIDFFMKDEENRIERQIYNR